MDHYEYRDIPRDRWLYADRTMAKWLGWLLSDHTAFLSAKQTAAQPTPLLPEQSAAQIDACLQQAWEHTRPIKVQLQPEYDDEDHAPELAGAIMGFAAGQLTLMVQTSGALTTILVADIRHVAPLTAKHWWAA